MSKDVYFNDNSEELSLEEQIVVHTQEVIQALTEDGTDLSREHVIMHYVSSENPDVLEKFARDVMNQGYEVSDIEHLSPDDFDDDDIPEYEDIPEVDVYECCVLFEVLLDDETIISQANELVKFIETRSYKDELTYGLWGTYLEGDDDDRYTDGHDLDLVPN